MTDWNPELYLQYRNERTQPALDLLSRIAVSSPRRIIDLGCGPGNSTELLRNRWPEARVEGLDSSEEMISKAENACPTGAWQLADIGSWKTELEYDVIFSNAALQWVPNHEAVFTRLMTHLRTLGVLAVQVPFHYESPLHRSIIDVSNEPGWAQRMASARRALTCHPVSFYYDLLAPICSQLTIWTTEYYHTMDSPTAILEWIRSTGLRPFLSALDSDEEIEEFEARLLDQYENAYPPSRDGKVIFPFNRLFILALR